LHQFLIAIEELRLMLFIGMTPSSRDIWTLHNVILRTPVKALIDQSMEI
jgi:hypothetical protein